MAVMMAARRSGHPYRVAGLPVWMRDGISAPGVGRRREAQQQEVECHQVFEVEHLTPRGVVTGPGQTAQREHRTAEPEGSPAVNAAPLSTETRERAATEPGETGPPAGRQSRPARIRAPRLASRLNSPDTDDVLTRP